MEFSCGLSLAPDGLEDVAATARRVRADLPAPPTLVTVFATGDFAAEAEALAAVLHEALEPGALVGCTAQGVVSGNHEIEHAPAVSIWACHAPDLVVATGHVDEPAAGSSGDMPDLDAATALLLLADPFSFPAETFLSRLDAEHDGVACFGGLASGGQGPGANALWCDGAVHRSGAVVAALSGPVQVRTLVSQGCRPIGAPYLVTAAEANVIAELGGKPALERLVQVVADLAPEDRELVNQGVHVGRVVDEHKVTFGRGDFLIRNVLGADRDSGAIAIGDVVEVGSTVQFHVRDATTAEEDLDALLADVAAGSPEQKGALLFTCNGRGRRFFGAPDHDAAAVTNAFDRIAVGGFFCAGEIGPVGGTNHLHGFTASIGLFGPRPAGARG